MQVTNALTPALASTLSGIPGDLNQGTVVSVEVRKKGVQRGPAGARTVYNDEFVHVLIWSGFSYRDLVARSQAKLEALRAARKGKFIQSFLGDVQKVCPEATMEDVCAAIQETENAMSRALRREEEMEGDLDPQVRNLPPSVWAPLEIDGKIIPRARVYVGIGDITDPRAPIKGTVYLHGIKLGERVLVPAPNGRWNVNKKPKTIAKDLLVSWLPISLFRQYALEPERTLAIRVGDAASAAAKHHAIQIDPDAIRSAFRIAP